VHNAGIGVATIGCFNLSKNCTRKKARSRVSARSAPPASRINGSKSANKVVKGRISCSYSYPRALPPASSNLIKNGIVNKQH
jgi:hypothetical protein